MIYAWVLALRPKTLTAAVVPIGAATALAYGDGGPVRWWAAACALLSAALIQIGTNFVNDALDFRKGADDERRIGPIRVTQSGALSERAVLGAGFGCFLAAAVFGLPLVILGGWPIAAIGIVSLFCGYAYTGGPYPLAYKGLGDLFVIVFFGLIAVGGVFYLHRGFYNLAAFAAGAQIGMLAAVLIAVNNLRDSPLDVLVDKRTLAVRYGQRFARAEIAALCFAPFALGIYWAVNGRAWAAALPLLALPFAFKVARGVRDNEPSSLYNRYLALAAALHLVFGACLSIGLGLGPTAP